jgi:hypothetical protein
MRTTAAFPTDARSRGRDGERGGRRSGGGRGQAARRIEQDDVVRGDEVQLLARHLLRGELVLRGGVDCLAKALVLAAPLGDLTVESLHLGARAAQLEHAAVRQEQDAHEDRRHRQRDDERRHRARAPRSRVGLHPRNAARPG